jgi:hypothetical protein
MSSKLTPNRRGGLRDFPGGGYPQRSLLVALELHDPSARGGHDVSLSETEAIA